MRSRTRPWAGVVELPDFAIGTDVQQITSMAGQLVLSALEEAL